MNYDAVVVGGGVAGLTAAAYLVNAGRSTLLCEKESSCGGLVNTFVRDGFHYDGGARAMESSGIILPMLRQLGIEVDHVRSQVSVGIEDRVIRLASKEDLVDYESLLVSLYPENKAEIEAIIVQIRKITDYMDVLYGIDNPLFLDMKKDREYLVKVIVPWMFKYALTIPKISAMHAPVVDYLRRYTRNQSLLDIITQHFFQQTPAYFALSYIKLYLEYVYPMGGTGKMVEKMVSFIENHGGRIRTSSRIVKVDPGKRLLTDANGEQISYQRLVWAADQKALYRGLELENVNDDKVKSAVVERQALLKDKTGNDSVLTLFLGLDLDKSYFSSKASEHFFYTPSRTGQSVAGSPPLEAGRQAIEKWMQDFFRLTTYEISIPVLRDSSLAPPGKTGLIVSMLFDYGLTRAIQEMGWYEAFKTYCEQLMIENLDSTIFPGLKNAVIHQFSSTPLTMEKYSGNTDGAITGWSFTNLSMPAESRLPKIANSIRTPIPGVYQAGQWTFSPSGLPVSILTGKLAADKVIAELKAR
jgi:phytoene dehydrogenase-like protein